VEETGQAMNIVTQRMRPTSVPQYQPRACSCEEHGEVHAPAVEPADQFSPTSTKGVSTESLVNTASRGAVDLLNGFPLPATSLPALRELASEHHPEQVTHVIYHGGCPDGFGAALAAWKTLGDDVEYIGGSYNKPPPDLPADARVAMVDFSYPREQLLEFKDKVEDVVVLDHHKSAAKELEGLDFAVFDMERAGAGLSWHYFHPETPLPPLMAYLEDRDLWNNALPQTKEVTFALRKHPKKFEHWNQLNVEDLKKEGEPLVRAVNAEVDKACSTAHYVEIDGHRVPAVRHRRYASDIGNKLLENHEDAPFSAIYMKRDGGWKWELRSRGDVDVSVIAKKFGGGGHKAASGFWQKSDVKIPGSKQD
jgi:nanoRNase/pAp phosphatase (c-di-AMP/oligoRNAs hydrolase)